MGQALIKPAVLIMGTRLMLQHVSLGCPLLVLMQRLSLSAPLVSRT